MVHYKNYFTFIVPEAQGSEITIKEKEIYGIENSLVLPQKNHRKTFIMRPMLLPSFIYDVTEDEKKNIDKKRGIDFAPLPAYDRDCEKIKIWPLEHRFEKGAAVEFEIQKINYCEKIPFTAGNILSLPQNFIRGIKNGCGGAILFSQENFSYVLEKWEDNVNYQYKTKDIFMKKIRGYLSVKDILDPDNGIERLIEDILRGSFAKNQIKNRQKMGKLLDIIRVAKTNEEEKIMEALLKEDENFFNEVQNHVFQDDLLPYMSKKELSFILSKAPDEILISMFSLKPVLKDNYKKLISKNRMKDLEYIHQKELMEPAGPESNFKTILWEYIENYYRSHKERFLYISDEKHIMRERIIEIIKETPRKDVFENVFKGKVVTLKSDIQFYDYKNNSLFFKILKPLIKLSVVVEKRKGLYAEYQFDYLKEGILEICHTAYFHRYIFAGAFDYEKNFIESMSCRVDI
ncbi:MAG: hypothetical protein OEZ22_06665 [Spirochaetia bacterium]|nr:hypothetical protein [Spirochaetia bacterium]